MSSGGPNRLLSIGVNDDDDDTFGCFNFDDSNDDDNLMMMIGQETFALMILSLH